MNPTRFEKNGLYKDMAPISDGMASSSEFMARHVKSPAVIAETLVRRYITGPWKYEVE